jgi:hypothetical protein
MERLSKHVICRGLFSVLAFVCCLRAQTLKQITTIDLPGPKGERFDYLTMDDEDHYLLWPRNPVCDRRTSQQAGESNS